jgi:membrane carboxypeptidase/penicillin-binding protein
MVGSVEEGTGKNARLNNVVIGGKTGTAQIYKDGYYSRDHYHSSFVGFLPVEKPKLICFIQIASPKIGKYGSMVAAPIFKSIMERIVEADLDLVPHEQTINRDELFVEKILNEIESDSKKAYFTASNIAELSDPVIDTNARKTPSKMPDLTGVALRTAMTTLNNYGIDYKVEGNGRIEWQSILPGSSLSSGDVVLLKCETKNSVQGLILN